MDLYKLRCFVTIVEAGTMTRAASILNMTQPPLSMLIKRLEEELNITLFDRSSKYLKLTKTGEIFYEKTQELLTFASDIKHEITDYEQGVKGVIKIGCAITASRILLPDVLKKVQELTPEVLVKSIEGSSSYIFNELKEQRIDVGIIPVVYETEKFDIFPLYEDELLAVFPSLHPLTNKVNLDLKDFRDEKLILTTTTIGYGTSDQIIEYCQSKGFSPNIIYLGTDFMSTIQMVSKNLGIAFLPSKYLKIPMFYNFVKYQQIKIKKLNHPSIQVKYSAITFKRQYNSLIIKNFIDLVKDVSSKLKNDELDL
ncbi:LysR family transcriptional regulator [Virgibacillus sp. W0181]|uniref:LysR family transcriptional regulator n=1 Tax=Virgibacillus sp. W0181 TaxID=3391581 RepID=UPI003F46F229